MAADVKIDIAAEFIGKKAFKQADVATAKLSRSVKSLAASLGIAFGARGIGRAIKAFAEDDKAARALGQTLNNLGLAYGSNAATINGYISRLEQQTGVLDDELRPAMDRFLRATQSVTKSQELLNLALDISAGTGKSLTQVSQSLQKAYLGQTQALGRLGVGLSKAELTSSSFEEIQARLAVLFAGQASTAANTYAGELAKLQVAANNARETIGKGFVDALKTASGSSTIDPLIAGIGKIANAFAGLTRETGKFIAITREAFDFSNGLNLFAPKGGYGNQSKGMGNISMSVSSQDTQRADLAARNKANAAAAAAAAKLAGLQKAATKAQQDSLKLAKARAVFDLQKIQIEAALKGKISEEDAIRLKLMKAIEDENVAAAEKYQKALDESQKKTAELAALLATVKAMEVKDPFSTWSIDPLTASINALTTSIGGVGTAITATGKEYATFTAGVAATVLRPNLTEWSSSFSKATGEVTAALTTATTGITKTATDATVSLLTTSKAASSVLGTLYIDGEMALTDAANSATADFAALATDTLQGVKTDLAAVTAELAAAIAAATAQAAANAADLAGAGNAGSTANNISITVEGSVLTENDLAAIVNDAINNSSAAGNAVGFNRTATIMSTQ